MSGNKVGDLSELFTVGLTKEQIIASSNDAIQAKSPGSVNQAFKKADKMKAKIDIKKEKQKLKEEQDSNTGSQDSPSLKKKTKQNLKRKSVTSNSPATDSGPLVKKGKNVKKQTNEKNVKRQTNVKNVNKRMKKSKPKKDPSLGIVHESLLQRGKKRELCEDVVSDDEDEQGNDVNVGKKGPPVVKRKNIDEDLDMPRKKHKNKELSHTPEVDKRIVFIGNLSPGFKFKKLVKMFEIFGKIESTRQIRDPVQDPDQLKQVAAIKKEFHEEQNTCICYMKFKKESSARRALVNNGKLVNNLPIQVDLADGTKGRDPKKTVFVGKLPYDVGEEAVRAHFGDCGDIDNVHIVKPKKKGVGNGFGYVRFTDAASVQLALKLDGSSFQKMLLKVRTCDNKAPAPKSSNQSGKPNTPAAAISNPKPASNTDTIQEKKAKRAKKRSKKSNSKSGSSGLFAINKPQKVVNKNVDKNEKDKVDTNKTKPTKFPNKDKSGSTGSPRDQKQKRVLKPKHGGTSFSIKNVSKAGKKKSPKKGKMENI